MLQKNQGISFGGMWVFPGGKIDGSDYPKTIKQNAFPDNIHCDDIQIAAKNAAIRETQEETGLNLNTNNFIPFAHWTPPPSAPKRFATWFFAAATQSQQDIRVDGGEILNHRWINPAQALAHHQKGDIDLAPPTWLTLFYMQQYRHSTEAINALREQAIKI